MNYIYKNKFQLEDQQWILNNVSSISMDTETSGLNPNENDIKLLQIFAEQRIYLLKPSINLDLLLPIMHSEKIEKIFHHAVFDLQFLSQILDIKGCQSIICTKLAYKLITNNTEASSLKILLKKFLNVEISKDQQLSDWSHTNLSNDQIDYAIKDVIYLKELWIELKTLIDNSNIKLVEDCFKFIPTYVLLKNKELLNVFEY